MSLLQTGHLTTFISTFSMGLKVFCLFASPCGARGDEAFVLVVAMRSNAVVQSSTTACSRFTPWLSSSADVAGAPALLRACVPDVPVCSIQYRKNGVVRDLVPRGEKAQSGTNRHSEVNLNLKWAIGTDAGDIVVAGAWHICKINMWPTGFMLITTAGYKAMPHNARKIALVRAVVQHRGRFVAHAPAGPPPKVGARVDVPLFGDPGVVDVEPVLVALRSFQIEQLSD